MPEAWQTASSRMWQRPGGGVDVIAVINGKGGNVEVASQHDAAASRQAALQSVLQHLHIG